MTFFNGLPIAGDCTTYAKNIYISDGASADPILNLNGLQNLVSIEGFLIIYNCTNLVDLMGLESLTSVGEFLEVILNYNLSSLTGLENLISVGGGFIINENLNLSTLDGLDNLTSIGGQLTISNNNLSNLTGLENLTSLEGGISINGNPTLSSLAGLDNLISLGGSLAISYNGLLTNLNELGNLVSIGGNMSINVNDSLESLSGLENVNSIGGNVFIFNNSNLSNLTGLEGLTLIDGHLSIRENNNLLNLNGLDNLVSIAEYLWIYENENLESLAGLENLTSVGWNLSISNNPQLVLCATPLICNIIVGNQGILSLYDNAPGCNTEDEILSRCAELGSVTVSSYFDLNQNAIQDTDEPLLPNASVLIAPGDCIVYGNASSGGTKYLNFGTYMISFNENDLPDWEVTNGISTYVRTLDSLDNNDTISFGLHPGTLVSSLSTNCVNGLPRCNEFVTFEPLVVNEGTSIASGTLWFDIDPAVLAIEYLDAPDSLDGDNRVGWFFTNLYPGHTLKREISLQMPGPPDFPIGDLLEFGIQVDFEDENGAHSNPLNTHRVEVRCSFDPNDKLVSPEYPDNYALIGEDLIYTVRFQNTGNAEAYDVVIKDLLSSDLDLSTFRYITSSHEDVLTTYIDDRMLTFEFIDIFLPDSTTNFDGSQGYVMYSIRANETVEENTNIENTANIFFDYNPAVVTNTTENVMLSTFDFDQDGFTFWEDCNDEDALVNPAVAETPYNGIDDDCNEATIDDDLDQDGFLLADDCDDENALVNSAAVEIPYNGLNDDCNELTLDNDLDQDGFLLADDCDDQNPEINTAADEIPNNGIDEDCDGEDLIVSGTNSILTAQPQVFPNPTSGLVQVVFSNEVQGTYELRDLTGKLIHQSKFQQETTVDLEAQVNGVYVLLLKTDTGVWAKRVVKQSER